MNLGAGPEMGRRIGRSTGTILAAVLLLVGTMHGAASACPGDSDGDGVCDANDNCPAIGNAGQENTFGGPAGDACEPIDIDLNIIKAKLKSGRGEARGRIVAKGDFVLPNSTSGAFTGTTSVEVRIVDTIGLDESFTVPCFPATSTRLKCLSESPRVKVALKFGPPGPTASAVRFKLRAVRLLIDAPFKEAVTVSITDTPSGTLLAGSIVDCQQKNTLLKCREF